MWGAMFHVNVLVSNTHLDLELVDKCCFSSFKSIVILKLLTNSYSITFPSVEKTGRKLCSIREHIIGIVMVSESDFDNVACIWSCNAYTFEALRSSIPLLFLSSSVYAYQ